MIAACQLPLSIRSFLSHSNAKEELHSSPLGALNPNKGTMLSCKFTAGSPVQQQQQQQEEEEEEELYIIVGDLLKTRS